MRVYIIGPRGLNKCTELNIKGVIECLENSDTPETWEIEIVEMTQEEYDILPEFDGF